jgi:hypothetical protein
MDLLSMSDPCVAVFEKNNASGLFYYFSATETVPDNHSPRFKKQFHFDYDSRVGDRILEFRVYDVDRGELNEMIGSVQVSLLNLVRQLKEWTDQRKKLFEEQQKKLTQKQLNKQQSQAQLATSSANPDDDSEDEAKEKKADLIDPNAPLKLTFPLANLGEPSLDQQLRSRGTDLTLTISHYQKTKSRFGNNRERSEIHAKLKGMQQRLAPGPSMRALASRGSPGGQTRTLGTANREKRLSRGKGELPVPVPPSD